MELQYEKCVKDNNLSISELPEDAVIGIENIKEVLKGIKILEGRGVKPKEKTLKKIKAMDKWVYYEILDFMQDTDNNKEDIPFESEEVLDDLKQEENKLTPEQEEGLLIESELEQMYKTGKQTWTIDEFKNSAKKAYLAMFDNYEEGEENGVATNKYTIVETEKLTFKLSKN